MLAPDPARAAREIRRVLRPGGRVALAVWGPRESNPWLGLVFDAVSAQIGKPLPPPGMPGPFSLADSNRLTRLLIDAGLTDVDVNELPTPLRAGSFEEWLGRTSALAGPLTKMLASLPEGATQALRARLKEATSTYETPTGLEFPGLTLSVSLRDSAGELREPCQTLAQSLLARAGVREPQVRRRRLRGKPGAAGKHEHAGGSSRFRQRGLVGVGGQLDPEAEPSSRPPEGAPVR